MQTRRYICTVVVLLGMTATQIRAQEQPKDTTLNRTVVVEQEYAPDIEKATKINVLPRVEEPTMEKREAEYDNGWKPAETIPAPVMEGFPGKESGKQTGPGYVRAGYGNMGNVDVYASYLPFLRNGDRLKAIVSLRGVNGERELPEKENQPWDAHYYRTEASLGYMHAFRGMELSAEGNFGLSNFSLIDGKQRFTSGDLGVGVRSTDRSLPLQYRGKADVAYYERSHKRAAGALSELQVRIEGEVYGSVGEGQQVGIGFRMNNLFYDCDELPYGGNVDDYRKSYTTVGLNPYYTREGDSWQARVGIHADPSFGSGQKLQLSPDVKLQYSPTGQVRLYVQATGGRRLNDYRYIESAMPYAEIGNHLPHSYEQLNASGGVKVGSNAGFQAHLYGGIRLMEDEIVEVYGGENGIVLRHELPVAQSDLKHGYAGLELTYSYREAYTLHGSLLYRKWEKEGEELHRYAHSFLPTIEADFYIEARPTERWQLQLGYRHIARSSNEYYHDGDTPDPVTNLYLNGSYELFNGIGLYVRASNLLNKSYQYHWGYPAAGISLLGGLSFRF